MSSPIQRIKIGTVRVGSKTEGGRDWDSGSSPRDRAPDLSVEVSVGGGQRAVTRTANGTFEHAFDEVLPVKLVEGDRLTVTVKDVDPEWESDQVIGTHAHTLTASDVAAGKLELSFGSVETLQISFEGAPAKPARKSEK